MTLHTGRFTALVLTVLCLLFTSCENDHKVSKGKGEVMLSLYSDVVLKSPAPISEVDDFNFRFVGVDGYGTSEYYRYGDVEWPFKWYFGIYKLQAESCSLIQAEDGYGCLRYEGLSNSFSVINDKIATAQVTCSVANVNVNISFDDSMFEAYEDFKLNVETIVPVITEEGDMDISDDYEVLRTLEFDAINKSGFYNLANQPIILKYTVYIKEYGAVEFMESMTGYFVEPGDSNPAILNRGDLITFRVKYIGAPVVSPGVKFIVSGNRTSVNNSVILNDYVSREEVKEDE